MTRSYKSVGGLHGRDHLVEIQLPMQLVPRTTIVVILHPAQGDVYLIQPYVI